MLLIVVAFIATTFFHVESAPVSLTIRSNALKTINKAAKTSLNLLSLDGYYTQPLYTSLLSELRPKYGVNTIGFGAFMNTTIFHNAPTTCCDTVADLKKYIQSGQACANFQKSPLVEIWTSGRWKTTGLIPYMMLLARCTSDHYNPIVNKQCAKLSPFSYACQGIPNNKDGWWSMLFTAFVDCTLQSYPSMERFHVWNEADFYKCGNTGTNYASFFQQVSSAIKTKHPNVKVGGPVSWTTPFRGTKFADWWVPLMRETLNGVTVNGKKLPTLDFFDYHAYQNSGGNFHDAHWDMVLTTVHSINHFYKWAFGGPNLLTHITETNFDLTSSQSANSATVWQLRVIGNAEQVMALSHMPDKFGTRLQYGIGVPGVEWAGSTEMSAYEFLKDLQGMPLVSFGSNNAASALPFRENGVTSQVVYDQSTGMLVAYLINGNAAANQIKLSDSDRAVSWTSGSTVLLENGGVVTKSLPLTISGSTVSATLPPFSLSKVMARYHSKPNGVMAFDEFLPIPSTTQDCLFQGLSAPTVRHTCTFNFGATNGKPVVEAYLKLGTVGNGLTASWQISAKIGATSMSVWNGKVPYRYNEFKLTNVNALNGNGTLVVSVVVSGVQTNQEGWLGFVALVLGR